MAKKKPTKKPKKAAKKTKKKKAPPKKKEPEKPQRAHMKDIYSKHMGLSADRWVFTSRELEIFSFPRFFTGLIDVDLVVRPTIGKRLCVIGDPSVGKTMLMYILEAAAHKTCRECFMPIIPWINEETGEVVEACKCGKNDRMVVAHLDVEDSFDPIWASIWGVDIPLEEEERDGFILRKDENELYWVAIPIEGEAAFNFLEDAIKTGAVDLVTVDSIAVMLSKESFEVKDGKEKGVGDDRIASRARLVAQGMTRLVNAQIRAKLKYGARASVCWTNQYYWGPTQNPKQDPRRPSGGRKAGYVADQEMRIRGYGVSKDKTKGIDKGHKHLDVKFTAKKSKAAGTAGGEGQYRAYLDSVGTKHGVLTAGDTDEPERLRVYLEHLGLFKAGEGKTPHRCIGREFTKVKDLRTFLLRPDIQYICRYFIFRELLPVSALKYLRREHYDYSPFGSDIAFELFKETDDEAPDRVDSSGEPKGDQETPEETSWLFEED